MKAIITSLALTSALLANAAGQQQQPQQPPQQPPAQQPAAPSPTPAATPLVAPAPEAEGGDDEVVRITTNLVQVDAVVTDKDGKQVTGLTADDFEVEENGRPQKITNFSYISAGAPAADIAADAPAAKPTPGSREGVKQPPVPPARLRPEQVRRAVALVVDDLRMSSEGIQAARRALKKYVDEQLQPGDLVAIIRTSAGIGALQQFTSDRQQLHAAIERVRALARTTRVGAFTAASTLERLETQEIEPTMDVRSGRREESSGALELAMPADKRQSENLSEFRDTMVTVGTLGALNFVVRGLNELPGRKAVILFSDGISIFNQNSDTQDRNERVLSALRQLVDRATRASVVIYTIDTRGLQPTGPTAADDTAFSASHAP
ncbi:MAG TPA: VWA domain-containing protein, partial [Pyrinomonadaceae bacterium]